MARLTNQVVLITGCSSGGIGEALATAFADAGHRAVASARELATIQPPLSQRAAKTVQLDVTDPLSMLTAVQLVLDTYGRIDMVVNNAGFLLSAGSASLARNPRADGVTAPILG